MIDGNRDKIEDFEIQVEGHDVQEMGETIVFPVRVYHKNGAFAFVHGVPVRAEFYHALKNTEHWQIALLKILRQRIRDEVQRRLRVSEAVTIEDKVDFIHLDRQPLD